MKNLTRMRSKSFWILITCFNASTAFVLAPMIAHLWREIPEAEAKKQTLNIPSWSPLVKKSLPAVVVITTEALVEQAPFEFPGLPGAFRFYAPLPPERQRGQGSGFIINEDGYIITNQHVIDGAQKIKVMVGSSPREYDADVIGADEQIDVALLKIKSDEQTSASASKKIKWPFLPLGDSDLLELGDPVMALGNPVGLNQSVNTGIISQKHRGGLKPSGRDLYAEMMQLEMPSNPGASGGPLFDVSGRVVGVIESILTATSAVPFCIPINTIKAAIPQLLQKGQIDKSFLGVEPVDLTPQNAKALDLPEDEKGAVIIQIMSKSPAEKAGLKPMDVILEIDGQKVTGASNLRYQTAYKGIGKIVTLKVHRKSEGVRDIKVQLERRSGESAQLIKPSGEKSSAITIESVGLEIGNTPPEVQKELGLSDKQAGAQVIGVARRSAAEFAGIVPGDVIIEAQGRMVASSKVLKSIIDKAPKDSTVLIMTRRGKAKRFVPLQKH